MLLGCDVSWKLGHVSCLTDVRYNIKLAVKCGGHHYSSANSVENGLVIDMAALKDISIDKLNNRVTIGGGCLWGDVYTALSNENLVCVGGGVHVVGVGGHLTGGALRIRPSEENERFQTNVSSFRWLWAFVVQVWYGLVFAV
jgi:hypothetical protein